MTTFELQKIRETSFSSYRWRTGAAADVLRGSAVTKGVGCDQADWQASETPNRARTRTAYSVPESRRGAPSGSRTFWLALPGTSDESTTVVPRRRTWILEAVCVAEHCAEITGETQPKNRSAGGAASACLARCPLTEMSNGGDAEHKRLQHQ